MNEFRLLARYSNPGPCSTTEQGGYIYISRVGLYGSAQPLHTQQFNQPTFDPSNIKSQKQNIMFSAHRTLFFAIALLVCIAATAPLQHPSNDGSHTTHETEAVRQIGRQTAAVSGDASTPDSRQPTSLALQAL